MAQFSNPLIQQQLGGAQNCGQIPGGLPGSFNGSFNGSFAGALPGPVPGSLPLSNYLGGNSGAISTPQGIQNQVAGTALYNKDPQEFSVQISKVEILIRDLVI